MDRNSAMLFYTTAELGVNAQQITVFRRYANGRMSYAVFDRCKFMPKKTHCCYGPSELKETGPIKFVKLGCCSVNNTACLYIPCYVLPYIAITLTEMLLCTCIFPTCPKFCSNYQVEEEPEWIEIPNRDQLLLHHADYLKTFQLRPWERDFLMQNYQVSI